MQSLPWEEGCVFPVRFIASEDAGIADWAAGAFVAGGTELFLPKQMLHWISVAAARLLASVYRL